MEINTEALKVIAVGLEKNIRRKRKAPSKKIRK